jgi:tetratricopeptide (TPR) repeat protein
MKVPGGESVSTHVRAVCCGLVLVTLLLYLPVWTHGFVLYDDDEYVTNNPAVQAGLTWAGVKWALTTWHAGNWHPVTWLSHMLDCELFGLHAGAHHLVSVLLHCANSVLVLVLWWRLTRALWPSALAAALFAWHPLHVESVAWAAERKDVLCTLFFLLTLWAYARYGQCRVSSVECRVTDDPSRMTQHAAGSGFFYLLSLLFFALGLMSKPMVVTLPFVLLLLDYWPLQRGERDEGRGSREKIPHFSLRASHLLLEKIPFFAMSVAACVVTYLAQRSTAVATLREHPLGLRLGNAVVAYVRYLWNTIWPTNLAVIYPPPDRLRWGALLGAVAVLGIISALVWVARQRSPCLLTGWLWFLGTLVPVIGLVQVGNQALADRYTYIPLLGIFVAVCYGAWDLAARFRFSPAAVSLLVGPLLLGLMATTSLQLRYWKNSETLFAHAVAVTRDNSVAEVNLGAAYDQQGRKREALIHYREGLRIAEEHPHLSDTIATPAQKAVAYANLGGAFEQAGYAEEAAALYRQALDFDPGRADLHEHLGSLLANLDQPDEAMRQLTQAARFAPTDPRPHFLMGSTSFRNGRHAEAIAHFRDALRLNPDDVDTLSFLAQVLAWDADAKVRNGTEAVALAEHANQLSGGRNPNVLDTLAMAYAETRRFVEAEQLTRKAIELAMAAKLTNHIRAMEERLRLYQTGQPYRQAATNSVPGGTR